MRGDGGTDRLAGDVRRETAERQHGNVLVAVEPRYHHFVLTRPRHRRKVVIPDHSVMKFINQIHSNLQKIQSKRPVSLD